MMSRSHQGIWSPPPKKEPTESKNLPILTSIVFASLLRVLVTNKKFSVPFKYFDFMFLPIQVGELEEKKYYLFFNFLSFFLKFFFQ